MKYFNQIWAWMEDNLEYHSVWTFVKDSNLGMIMSAVGAYGYAVVKEMTHLFWTSVSAFIVMCIGILGPMLIRLILHKLKKKHKFIEEMLEHDNKKKNG